jgi:hypothetical protein
MATNVQDGEEWTDGEDDAVGLLLSFVCRTRGSWCCGRRTAVELRAGVVAHETSGDSVAVMGRVGGNTSRPNLVKSRQQMSKRRREESSG